MKRTLAKTLVALSALALLGPGLGCGSGSGADTAAAGPAKSASKRAAERRDRGKKDDKKGEKKEEAQLDEAPPEELSEEEEAEDAPAPDMAEPPPPVTVTATPKAMPAPAPEMEKKLARLEDRRDSGKRMVKTDADKGGFDFDEGEGDDEDGDFDPGDTTDGSTPIGGEGNAPDNGLLALTKDQKKKGNLAERRARVLDPAKRPPKKKMKVALDNLAATKRTERSRDRAQNLRQPTSGTTVAPNKPMDVSKLKQGQGQIAGQGMGWSSPGSNAIAYWRPLPNIFTKPKRFLPRMFYFEPTYLGGNAGVAERMRRLQAHLPDARQRILDLARTHPQDFDAPPAAGMALSARLATPWIDKPQRVLLQVGLQGSKRFGWRRPPLDVVLVLDAPLMQGSLRAARGMIRAAISRLGVQDRLGIVGVAASGGVEIVAPVQRVRDLELGLDRMLDGLPRIGGAGSGTPSRALATSGELLRRAAADATQVPGTQTVWLVTAGTNPRRVRAASQAADALTRAGVVTSVIEMGAAAGRAGAWWQVASKGHGNYHRPQRGKAAEAISQELDALSKVVARLLRVNVRMAKGVGAIRVIGSRVLDPDEVKQLKAREKAVDIALSKTMGVKADRGDDDDGIQTNIPYFYGGDSHVILVELWVEKPGAVADITIKYKDMVNLKNATAQTSVAIHGTPRGQSPNLAVARNFASFSLAERLIKAGYKVKHGRSAQARTLLQEAAGMAATPREARIVQSFLSWLSEGTSEALSEALIMAGRRQIGQPAAALAGGEL